MRSLSIGALLLATASAGAQALDWTVVPGGSELAFVATFEQAPAPGRFRRFDVALRFDPERPEGGRLDVVVHTPSADLGNDDVDRAVRGPDWFDGAAHPTAEFRATDLRRTGASAYVARGTLTLKGVAKPLDVPFTWTPTPTGATMTGQLVVDRLAFNVGSGEWRSTKQVGGEVRLRFTLQLRRPS